MLGKSSRRTRKKLEQNGRRASATVVAVGERGMAITHGSDNVVSNTEIALKLTLRVEPQDEPAFEVEERFRFAQLSIPTEGQHLAVIYDPDEHDAIMLDGNPAPNIAFHEFRGPASARLLGRPDRLRQGHAQGALPRQPRP